MIYSIPTYIFKNVYSPTLRPKGVQKPFNLHSSPKCWHDIFNANIYIQKCIFPNPAPEGRTETLQLTFLPQVLAWYIQYQHYIQKCIFPHPAPEGRTETLQLTFIPQVLKLYVGIEYIMPKLGGWMWVGVFQCALRAQGWGIYVSWKYRLVLDILCQHLGAEWSLESFCAPFGRRVGECTFLNIYVGIEYIMPTLGGSMWVVGFLCALRAQGWGIYIFEYIFWYWIYHANTWGKNVSWRVSVRPSGAGLGWVGQTA